jgi:hypothetical protein
MDRKREPRLGTSLSHRQRSRSLTARKPADLRRTPLTAGARPVAKVWRADRTRARRVLEATFGSLDRSRSGPPAAADATLDLLTTDVRELHTARHGHRLAASDARAAARFEVSR